MTSESRKCACGRTYTLPLPYDAANPEIRDLCRLGCVGCPLAGGKQMEFEFQFFPKYYVAYLRTFARMIKERADMAEKYGFVSPLDVMHWWMWKSHLPNDTTTQSLLINEGIIS